MCGRTNEPQGKTRAKKAHPKEPRGPVIGYPIQAIDVPQKAHYCSVPCTVEPIMMLGLLGCFTTGQNLYFILG